MIIQDQTQDVMRLLSQVILADGHIHDSEVAALIVGIKELNLKDKSEAALSQDQIRAWFKSYQQELNVANSQTPKDVALTHIILRLADWPNKQAVVDVLEKISLSDAEFHIEEKTFISIVRAYWQYDGLDAPGATIEAVTP